MTSPPPGNRQLKVIRLANVAFFLVAQLKTQTEHQAESGMQVLLVSASGPELAQLKVTPNLRHVPIEFARPIRP